MHQEHTHISVLSFVWYVGICVVRRKMARLGSVTLLTTVLFTVFRKTKLHYKNNVQAIVSVHY